MSPTHYHAPDYRQREREKGASGCAVALCALALFTLVIWWGAAMAWHASAVRTTPGPEPTSATVQP